MLQELVLELPKEPRVIYRNIYIIPFSLCVKLTIWVFRNIKVGLRLKSSSCLEKKNGFLLINLFESGLRFVVQCFY